MPFIHFDEAKPAGLAAVKEWLRAMPPGVRALLILDLLGKLRLVLWDGGAGDSTALEANLAERCGPWWTGEVLRADDLDQVTRDVYERAWGAARPAADEPRARVHDRHRSRTAWFTDVDPPWLAPEGAPPIIAFYSFKGGLGRSTILASFAIQRAQAGERVCVLDLDLDSPGVGRLLAADAKGLTASWGVVDFLLEHAMGDAPLADYYHRCDRVAGAGELVVFPAGSLDEGYADKLARVDLDEMPGAGENRFRALLQRVRDELAPRWILLDARTGVSELAGQVLAGIAHLHVLLGTTQEQSWQGLNLVLDRLGKKRILADRSQADVLLVQALVPPGEAGSLARREFLARAEHDFSERYYAEAGEAQDEDRFWDTGDMDSLDAPHVPVAVDYDARLASFGDIADVVNTLSAGPYQTIAERIASRFTMETEE
jgi:cellulose biosynthesis protein BcsQ